MNLRPMAVYCKVVERGVMARAAEELGMTPAAVTKTISELERALGVRLLNRTTRKLQLTEAGRRYYEASTGLLAQAEEIHQRFSSLSDEVKGRLRMVAPMSYGLSSLADVIAAFQKRYPKVEVSLHLDDRITDLVEEGFDLAIRIRREMKDSSLIAKLFDEFEIHLVCSRGYAKSRGPIRSPEALSGHPCMAYLNSPHPTRWTLQGKAGQAVHSFVPSFESNNSLLLKELMLKDQGICVLPSFLIQDEIDSGRAVRLLPGYSLGSAKGWVVYPSRRYNPPAVTRFAEFFLEWHSRK